MRRENNVSRTNLIVAGWTQLRITDITQGMLPAMIRDPWIIASVNSIITLEIKTNLLDFGSCLFSPLSSYSFLLDQKIKQIVDVTEGLKK